MQQRCRSKKTAKRKPSRSYRRRCVLGESLEQRCLLAGDAELCFEPLQDTVVQIGSPLHVAIDASDPSGSPVTVAVDVANDDLLQSRIIGGNRSARIRVEGFGDIVFELFEQRAPEATGRFIELAESGFYDGLNFHQVIDDILIQTGDPTGTGNGGSSLGEFDDEFHPDLQHNRPGVLSFAQTADDQNNSQFFIIESSARQLDFNNPVFGQVVEGDAVRESISEVSTNGLGQPDTPVVIESVTIFHDVENSIVMLKPRSEATGSTEVTFTIRNANSETFSQTINVTVAEDTANSQPYLLPLDLPIFTSGATAQFSPESFDVEGDPVEYSATTTSSFATVSVDSQGVVSVDPDEGFEGSIPVLLSVQAVGETGDDRDHQLVSVEFSASTLDLLDADDTGVDATDNITRQNPMTFEVTQVRSRATVELVVGDVVVGTAEESEGGATVNADLGALGDGDYRVVAREVLLGAATAIATLDVTLDRQAPTGMLTGTSRHAIVDKLYLLDLDDPEEGMGISYSLTQFPTGATIDSVTGRLLWTPTSAQAGSHQLEISRVDLAGNEATQTMTIDVIAGNVATVQLEVTDLNGVPITRVDVGEEFLLNLYAIDNRELSSRAGIFAVYSDIAFDSGAVNAQPVPIQYDGSFTVSQSGSLITDGIDELGATSSDLDSPFVQTALVATIRMVGVSAGNTTLSSSAADTTVLAYELDDPILPGEISFTSVNLAVIDPDFHREENPHDVNGDGNVTPRDALIVINILGQAGGVINLSSPLASILNPEFAYNVANDQIISALDALRVINFLAAQQFGGSGEGELPAGLSSSDDDDTEDDSVFGELDDWLGTLV